MRHHFESVLVAALATSNAAFTDNAVRYDARGVSADQGDVHAAIKDMGEGLMSSLLYKVVPDAMLNDPTLPVGVHSDGAGAKSSFV